MSFWILADCHLISSKLAYNRNRWQSVCGIGDKSFALYYKEEEGVGVGGIVIRVPRATWRCAGGGSYMAYVVCFHPAATCQVYFVSCFLLFCIGRMPKGHGSDCAVQSTAVIFIIQT